MASARLGILFGFTGNSSCDIASCRGGISCENSDIKPPIINMGPTIAAIFLPAG